MRIAVIGTGYVGLVTGACFAEYGNHVWCVDSNQAKIDQLRQGILPIYEPGLPDLVHRNTKANRLHVTTDLHQAIAQSTLVFLCVGTPTTSDGSPNLDDVFEAAGQVAGAMVNPNILVIKSTVPVGTAAAIRAHMQPLTSHAFDVVSNPEFLKEGAAVADFLRPDRVVIGTSKQASRDLLVELYAPFVRNGKPILLMDNASAELAKYGANTLLASRISFMNELANVADQVGADIDRVREAMGHDSRIGHAFLFAGVGYGGSCFPKDVEALARTGQTLGLPMHMVSATHRVNVQQKRVMVQKIQTRWGTDLTGRTIDIWGLSFKPNTDDVREAPALTIIPELLDAGATVQVFDPEAMPTARAQLPEHDRLIWASSDYNALQGADCLALITEWNAFRRPDWDRIANLLKHKIVFDGRNIFTPSILSDLGFEYYGIGRGHPLGAVSRR